MKYFDIEKANSRLIKSESGGWSASFQKWSINYSGILSFLAKEAAKCEHYASDLFISWEEVTERLQHGESFSSYFGCRRMGVDHEAFIRSRCESLGGALEYRSMYRLDVDFHGMDVRMNLYELELDHTISRAMYYYYDTETGKLVYGTQMLDEYMAMKESGETDAGNFGQYINNCLTENGGTLEQRSNDYFESACWKN